MREGGSSFWKRGPLVPGPWIRSSVPSVLAALSWTLSSPILGSLFSSLRVSISLSSSPLSLSLFRLLSPFSVGLSHTVPSSRPSSFASGLCSQSLHPDMVCGWKVARAQPVLLPAPYHSKVTFLFLTRIRGLFWGGSRPSREASWDLISPSREKRGLHSSVSFPRRSQPRFIRGENCIFCQVLTFFWV